ncbi:MAG: exodeoxyribonuclease VII large subunit [Oscillospiraceae bacterium]
MNSLIMTVAQLNRYSRSIIEGDINLQTVFVSGEISNCKYNSFSGHVYFSLKDTDAAIRCTMFKSDADRLKFVLEDGMKVICRARVTIYERDGQYQLNVMDIQAVGDGVQAIRFEQLKNRLKAEGLFNEVYKKPLPSFPKTIAVITSPTGAAIKDILNVLGRRNPLCAVIICPVRVQGKSAADEMISTFEKLDRLAEVDLIILARGGGSAEDLSAFNDEQLARTVFKCKTPVISAVGHESDFSLCDAVADVRAATPSAAAELATIDIQLLKDRIALLSGQIKKSINTTIEQCILKLSAFKRLEATNIIEPINFKFMQIKGKMREGFQTMLYKKEGRFKEVLSTLCAVNPLNTLERGYAIAFKDNDAIKSIKQISEKDEIEVRVLDGILGCTVNNKKEISQ